MVKVAIIDSGLDIAAVDSDLKYESVQIYIGKSGKIILKNTPFITDNLFHGTHCLKIIHSYNSNCCFYIIKVFDSNPYCDVQLIIAGIKWCIKNNVNIINVSLGFTPENDNLSLAQICYEAYNNNIIIVAADHKHRKPCFPAYYPWVIGVGNVLANEDIVIFSPESPIEFYTFGNLINITNSINSATSFSCAKITGLISKILNEKPKLTFDQVKDELKELSQKAQLSINLHENYNIFSSKDTWEYLFYGKKNEELLNIFNKKLSIINNNIKILVIDLINNNFSFIHNLKIKIPQVLQNVEIQSINFLDDIPDVFLQPEKYSNVQVIHIGNLSNFICVNNEITIINALKYFIQRKIKFVTYDKGSKEILGRLSKYLNSGESITYLDHNKKDYEKLLCFKYLPQKNTPTLALVGGDNSDMLFYHGLIKNSLEKKQFHISYISPLPEGNLLGASYSIPNNESSTEVLKAEETLRFLSNLKLGIQHIDNPDILLTGVTFIKDIKNSPLDCINNLTTLFGLNPTLIMIIISADTTPLEITNHLKLFNLHFEKIPILFLCMLEKNLFKNKFSNMNLIAPKKVIYFSESNFDINLADSIIKYF